MIGVDYRIVPDVSRETSALVAVNSKFDPNYMIAIGGYIGEDRVIEIIIAMTDLPASGGSALIVLALRKLAIADADLVYDAINFLHRLYIKMRVEHILFMCMTNAHRKLFKKYMRKIGYGIKKFEQIDQHHGQ